MSCSPFRILFENQLIGAFMESSPEALTLPKNLLTEQRSRAFRSHMNADQDGKIIQNILINRTDRNYVADSFAIAQHNLDGLDTVRIRLYDGEEQSGELTYDSGDVRAAVLIPMDVWQPGINYWGETYSPAGLDRITPVWFSPVRWRSALITITSNSNPAGYVDIGMMMLGLSFRPEYNFSYGNEMIPQPDLKLTRTQGGSLLTERGMGGHREMSLPLNWMSDSDRNNLSTESRKHAGKPILVSAYPEDDDQVRRAEYTMMAKLVTGKKWTHASDNQHKYVARFLEI